MTTTTIPTERQQMIDIIAALIKGCRCDDGIYTFDASVDCSFCTEARKFLQAVTGDTSWYDAVQVQIEKNNTPMTPEESAKYDAEMDEIQKALDEDPEFQKSISEIINHLQMEKIPTADLARLRGIEAAAKNAMDNEYRLLASDLKPIAYDLAGGTYLDPADAAELRTALAREGKS